MYRKAIFGAALLVACAAAPPAPTLPPPTDINEILGPRAPLPEIPGGLPDGPDHAVDKGQCRGLPSGILVSERRFAERIAAVAERDRLRTELGAYKKLRLLERDTAVDVDKALRQRIGEADRRAETRLWLGVLVGAGTVLVTGWAINKVGQ